MIDYEKMSREDLIALIEAIDQEHTAQVQWEADVKRVEEWFKHGQVYARFGIWDWDIQSGVTLLSEQIPRLFGQEPGTMVTTREHFLSAVHSEDRQRVIDAIHACTLCAEDCEQCADSFDIEYRIVRPDGKIRWMHERGGVERCDNGRPGRVLGIVQDITERKQSEQALRESERLFRLFAENIREMIWVASPNFDKMAYISHACADVLGLPAKDAHKELVNWEKLIHPADLPLVQSALRRQMRGEPAEVETRIIRRDGKVRWIRVQSFPVRNATNERMACGIAEDVTDRKQLEQERLDQMMAQRSNLVREVHHRIKNNLQGVAGLLRQQAYNHPEVGPFIDEAIAQVQTVAVVHGLQGKAPDNEVVLCEMVPSIARMVEAILPAHPAIEVNVDVPRRIRVNEQETVPIALILNELIMNSAKHAQPTEARQGITISVGWNNDRDHAAISIINPGQLPSGFDFGAGNRTGTGLELVRSLLPPIGADFRFSANGDQVEAVLALSEPCIYNLRVQPPISPIPCSEEHSEPTDRNAKATHPHRG